MTIPQKLDVEIVLSKFSLLSPYYVKLFSLLIFSGVTNAFYSVNYIFAATDIEYRCKYPHCENSTLIEELDSERHLHRCHRHPFTTADNCSLDYLNLSMVLKCDEWVYKDPNSFMAEFNLGCQDWKRTLVGTAHSFGYMIGLLILGPLADKIGRKKLVIVTGVTAATMGLGRSLTQTYWVYIALEFIEALFGDTYSTTFNLGVEMVTKENRVSFITIMTASTSLAGILMAFIAWSVPYWRNFLRVIYGPSLFFLLYIFLLDESLRWLLIKGRKEKAADLIRKAARFSHIDLNDKDIKNIECVKGSTGISMTTLLGMTFSSKKLLLRFSACVCMWITGLFNKYALLINSVELEGNKYINYGLTTLSELPASFVLGYLLKKYKRRIPLMFSFILTGVFCVAQSFVPKGYVIMSMTLFLMGKFMATISYATVYLYTSELFPTCTRNTMHALCSSLGRIATMLAPQTPLLIKYWKGLPSVLVGGMSLATGLVVVMMPDTSEEVLPDTVQEAEAFGSKFSPNKDVTKF